jgi:serine/threonine-protein kinase RsbW
MLCEPESYSQRHIISEEREGLTMEASRSGDGGSVDAPVKAERHIALRNDFSEIARFGEILLQLAEEQHLSKEQLFAVKLCAYEAITNIISYAFADAAEHQIDVLVTVTPREIQVEILDDGRPFDPLKVSNAPVADETADPGVGGRGIHFMRSFSNRLHYERTDGRNRLSIWVTREERPPAES